MHLVTSGNCVFWARKIAALLNDHVDDVFELLLDCLKWIVENDFGSFNFELQSDEIVLEWGFWIVLTFNNLIWVRIGWELVSLDEVNVGVDRLFDQLSDLVSHQSSN